MAGADASRQGFDQPMQDEIAGCHRQTQGQDKRQTFLFMEQKDDGSSRESGNDEVFDIGYKIKKNMEAGVLQMPVDPVECSNIEIQQNGFVSSSVLTGSSSESGF